jgi:hypothetical protein
MRKANQTARRRRQERRKTFARLSDRIDEQRRTLFQAAAIAGCLGQALANEEQPTFDAQYVAQAIASLTDGAAAALEPLALGLAPTRPRLQA